MKAHLESDNPDRLLVRSIILVFILISILSALAIMLFQLGRARPARAGTLCVKPGGGVWAQRGAPILQGNQIMDNQSLGLGQTARGGDVQLENSGATLISNTIAINLASGISGYRGGVDIIGAADSGVSLVGNTVRINTANGDTPAYHARGCCRVDRLYRVTDQPANYRGNYPQYRWAVRWIMLCGICGHGSNSPRFPPSKSA